MVDQESQEQYPPLFNLEYRELSQQHYFLLTLQVQEAIIVTRQQTVNIAIINTVTNKYGNTSNVLEYNV